MSLLNIDRRKNMSNLRKWSQRSRPGKCRSSLLTAKIWHSHARSELDFHSGKPELSFLHWSALRFSTRQNTLFAAICFLACRLLLVWKQTTFMWDRSFAKWTSWQQRDMTSTCAGCLAMQASKETNELFGLWKKHKTVMLNCVWYATLIGNH